MIINIIFLQSQLYNECKVSYAIIAKNFTNGGINACFIGCDRIARNGDVANKIGTSAVAILAKHYGIPFYVIGATSTIDVNYETGKDIGIEERNARETKKSNIMTI